MADNDWKARLGMVYSTNPDFNYETTETPEAETLPRRGRSCACGSTASSARARW